jgi:hypothetical protein
MLTASVSSSNRNAVTAEIVDGLLDRRAHRGGRAEIGGQLAAGAVPGDVERGASRSVRSRLHLRAHPA